MENLEKTRKYDIESVEFQLEFREKLAQRLITGYPLEQSDNLDLPDKVKTLGTKFPADGWVGDAFTHVAHEVYRLLDDDYDKLKDTILYE